MQIYFESDIFKGILTFCCDVSLPATSASPTPFGLLSPCRPRAPFPSTQRNSLIPRNSEASPNFWVRFSTLFISQLVVAGPYGIKLLNETLMWHIQSQVTELRKLVLLNKEILIALRTNFDKPDVMKELFKRLQNVDSVLQRMTIIGERKLEIPGSLIVFSDRRHSLFPRTHSRRPVFSTRRKDSVPHVFHQGDFI